MATKVAKIIAQGEEKVLSTQFKELGFKILKKSQELLKQLSVIIENDITFDEPLELSSGSEIKNSLDSLSNETKVKLLKPSVTLQAVEFDHKDEENFQIELLREQKTRDRILTDINTTYRPYHQDPTSKKFAGYAVFSYPNNDRYEGEWVKGKRNGSGCFTTNDGVIYDGRWQMDNIIQGNILNLTQSSQYSNKNKWYYSGKINMFRMRFGRKVTFKKTFLSNQLAGNSCVSQLLKNYIT